MTNQEIRMTYGKTEIYGMIGIRHEPNAPV